MPTLPFTLPAQLSVDAAVCSADDHVQAMPAAYRNEEHPVLEDLAAAHAAMHAAYQARADYAAAQSDVLRATGKHLDGLGEDRQVPRAEGELDDAYRSRIVSWTNTVSPRAIIAAVNEILAPLTTGKAQWCESLTDAWFVTDGSAEAAGMHSFVGDGLSNVCPRYPDRGYEDDASINSGRYEPQLSPGGALAFADTIGRHFLLRIPQLNDADAPRLFATSGDDSGQLGMFVSDGSGPGFAFASNSYLLSIEAYQAIADTVQRIKGHGIRFSMVVDRKI